MSTHNIWQKNVHSTNCLEDEACPVKVWLGKLTALDMTSLGCLVHKTSTKTVSSRNNSKVIQSVGVKLLVRSVTYIPFRIFC